MLAFQGSRKPAPAKDARSRQQLPAAGGRLMRSVKPRNGPEHVVITGASSGIGAALTRVYSGPGRRLSLIARDRARLEAVASDSRARGADVDVYVADVPDAMAIELVLLTCDLQQ